MEIIKHIREMSARNKVALLKFNNTLGIVYYHELFSGVQYEDNEVKNEIYSEEYQEDEYYTEIKNDENED